MGDRLKSAYGEFCSRHNEAVQLYKVLHKSDVNFQAFIKVSSLCLSFAHSQSAEMKVLSRQKISQHLTAPYTGRKNDAICMCHSATLLISFVH